MKASEVTSNEKTTEQRQQRLEMNRAAAMRSRNKKKMEMMRFKSLVVELSNEKALLLQKIQQYEMLIQASYTENSMLKVEMSQLIFENSMLKQTLKY
ncbi:unnamed protein product [Blepharisma stoltei]|uniref:BZIP domain-containing protein n=1 Tax=Blepharisma stoltei TaxID=1481888 RepID=A0AAU9KAR5_9CILI|nr:unnamed protein product [Blepharisma stoltei]